MDTDLTSALQFQCDEITPPFSIIITCYNQAAFIREAVESALNQSFMEKQIIVVDDFSSDGSIQLLRQYNDAIRLIALQRNVGAARARNLGASIASGNFLVFLDGDDVLMPWALDIYHQIIEARRPKVVLGKLLFFDERLRAPASRDRPRRVRIVEYPCFMKKDRAYRASASSAVVDRQSFASVGGWSVGFFPFEDIDLMIKLGYSGRAVLIVSPATAGYRRHARNVSRQTDRMFHGLFNLIRKQKSGEYMDPRGSELETCGVIGGVVFYWLKRAFKANLYYLLHLRIFCHAIGVRQLYRCFRNN